MTATVDISSLCSWSAPREVATARGKRLLRTAAPTPAFRSAWNRMRPLLKLEGVELDAHEARWLEDPQPVEPGKRRKLVSPRMRTAADMDGSQFAALCARSRRGEVQLVRFGTGSSNGVWDAEWIDLTVVNNNQMESEPIWESKQ